MSDFSSSDKINSVARQGGLVPSATPSASPPANPQANQRSQAKEQDAQTTRQDQTNQTPDHKADKSSQSYREPAISIDASLAHVTRGDHIQSTVEKVDAEGRPIMSTKNADYAIRPDAGLKQGDTIDLAVTRADTTVEADLMKLNGKPLEKPIPVKLTIVSTHDLSEIPLDKHVLDKDSLDKNALDKNAVTLAQDVARQIASTPLPDVGKAVIQPDKTVSEPLPQTPAAQKSLADFLALLPRVSASAASATTDDSQSTPAGLKTNSANLKTLLTLQAAEGLTKKMAVLTNLDAMQSPVSRLSIQAMPIGSNSLPQLMTIFPGLSMADIPQGPQLYQGGVQMGGVQMGGIVPTKIIAQTPVPEAILQQFGLQGQTLSLPVYQLTTAQGDLFAALPELMDLRGQTISLQSLPVTSVAGQTSASAPGISGLSENTAGAGSVLKLPTAMITNNPTAIPALMTADGARSLVTVQAATAQHPTPQNQGQITTITALQQTGSVASPTGLDASYQMQTPQGPMSFALSFAPDQLAQDGRPPLPFKIGEEIFIKTPTAAQATQAAKSLSLPPAPLQTYGGWPALNALGDVAADMDPLASEEISHLTAQTGGNLSTAVAYALGAEQLVKSMAGAEMINQLLPKNLAQALAGKDQGSSFFDQFIKEMVARSQTVVSDPAGNEWRSLTLPVDPRDPAVSLFAFLFRETEKEKLSPDAQNQGTDEGDEDARDFIIQVDFSHIGPLQLKGRLYAHYLNLVIETHSAFSDEATAQMTQIFKDALITDQMQGDLTFKTVEAFEFDTHDLGIQS